MFFAHYKHGRCHHASRSRGSRSWGPLFFSWDMGHTEMPGRGRRKRFDGGELRLLLLKLIAEQPRHGYDLIREIETMTGGAYAPSPGVVYPTLTLLVDMGLIVEQDGVGARKMFQATDEGRAYLAERSDEVDRLMQRVAAMGEQRDKSDWPAVRRAVGNLREVLADKLRDGAAEPEIVDEIVTAIDELSRRIERI